MAKKSGRPRLPTEQRKLVGNPGGRPLPIEPDYLPASSEPPARLTGNALTYWNWYAPRAAAVKIFTETDVPAMEQLCSCLAEIDELNEQIAREGMVIKGAYGPVRNPATLLRHQARDAAMRLMREFGFTPSSRASVAAAILGETTTKTLEEELLGL